MRTEVGMVTINETIVVTMDDTMLEAYKRHLKKEDGWKIEEDTTALYFKRKQTLSYEVNNE